MFLGGKTTHIASIIGEKVSLISLISTLFYFVYYVINIFFQGRVVALDKNNNKIRKLCQNLEYLNITNVFTFVFDSTRSYNPFSGFYFIFIV